MKKEILKSVEEYLYQAWDGARWTPQLEEHLSGTLEALGSICNTTQRKKENSSFFIFAF
jgi:hypothetical protein